MYVTLRLDSGLDRKSLGTARIDGRQSLVSLVFARGNLKAVLVLDRILYLLPSVGIFPRHVTYHRTRRRIFGNTKNRRCRRRWLIYIRNMNVHSGLCRERVFVGQSGSRRSAFKTHVL